MPFEPALLRRCWFVAGPTACGKSAVALELAERIDAEILSLDSMAVYRGMDIGTAKPTAADRRRVPHHLLDLAEPAAAFSVADYLAAAEPVCRSLLNRGKMPLFVGGTGLYLRSLLRGVFQGPAADADVRAELETRLAAHGPTALHAQLAQVDPVAAARLHPNDSRRVIRALEVAQLTGRPLSDQQTQPPLPPDERPPHVYWLLPPRDWLRARIDSRVDAMLADGLLQETIGLLDRGLGATARQALGYRELIEHLEGRLTLPEASELIKTRTRQFAKRQHTWFRNLEECHAVEITGRESAREIAERLCNIGT